MSTILRALKKAEQASMESHSGPDNQVGFTPRNPGNDSPAPGPQSRKKRGLIAATGGVIALLAVMLYMFEPHKDLPSPPVQIPAHPGMAEPDNGPVPPAAQPPLPQPLAHEKKSSGTVSAHEPAAPVLSHQPFDPATLPAPVVKKAVPVKRNPAQDSPEKSIPAQEKRPNQVQHADIQTLEPENLKIQAISWSRTPSARVAVINDRVLGENDMVEGYEIITINENDIILSNGSAQKFRLNFRKR